MRQSAHTTLGATLAQAAPPWINHVRKIALLFANDEEFDIDYDNETHTADIYVDNAVKAAAIDRLLRHEVEFGNVVLKVNVIPNNDEETIVMALRRAFEGNPALVSVEERDYPESIHAIFAPDVVQYVSDDLSSYFGITSTLYEELARDVFDLPDGTFCNTMPIDGSVVIA